MTTEAEEIEELKEIIRGERTFLHDLSNSLLVAQGMGTFVFTAISKEHGEEEKVTVRMKKVTKAVDKMITLINERRNELRSKTVESL